MSYHDCSDYVICVVHSEDDKSDTLVYHHKWLDESQHVKLLFVEIQGNNEYETSMPRPEEITLFDIAVEKTGKARVLPVIVIWERHDEHLLGLRMLTYMIAQDP